MSAPIDDRGVLQIFIGGAHAGDLTLRANDTTSFRLLDSYIEMPQRPVLGQIFEDDPSARHEARMRLPPFFSNLLPEGRLRELVAGKLDVAPEREFFLLAQLGEDLPGAIRARPLGQLTDAGEVPERGDDVEWVGGALKFSLAGVQLKLSMIREGRRMTLPAGGSGGDWIVKLPGDRYRGVPENEFAVMNWARLVGLEVPQTELIETTRLAGLPEALESEPGLAYAVRRFDRLPSGGRVHIEDFAQIRNVYPTYKGKYKTTNYETIGKTILRVAGEAAFAEFVRRLAFVVLTANADAHVKNWSLIYPDGVTARLSPAYDLVSTIEFIEHDALALNLGRTKAWEAMSLERFEAFAGRVGADVSQVTSIVRETVSRTLDSWPQVRRDYPVSELLVERLEQHWRRTPLGRA